MNKQNKIGFVLIRATPIMEILTGIMIAGFIYYTGFMVANGEIEINNFFSFLTAMMLAYQPIRSLATINMLFYQGAAGAERVFSVLDTEANIKENNTAIDLKINKGNVEFNNVSFSYPKTNEAAIKNINFSIEGGTTAALVGHSGAGKSTIINLLPRFYDPKNGEIYIDQQNIKNCAKFAKSLGLEVHAGHGMDYKTAEVLSKINEIVEFNIGHFLIGESIVFGLKKTIKQFKKILKK